MNRRRHRQRTVRPARTKGETGKDFLLALGDRLRATEDAGEVKAIAVEMLQRHFGTNRIGYREIDDKGETIRDLSGPSATLPLTAFGPGIAEELRAGKTVLVKDSDTDPRTAGDSVAQTWASLRMRSTIAVPLIRNRRLVALLFAIEPRPRHWTRADMQLMQDVADRTWEAVERARAEEALRKSEERLRKIADAMPALISSLDAGLHYRFVNQIYCDWFKLPREQILGRHLRDVLGPELYEARRPYLQRALAGERVTYEAQFTDKPPRHIVTQHVPHLAEDGRVIGIYSLIQDVTEQKKAEAALRQSRDEFAAVLEAVPAGIVIADRADGRVALANRAATEMLRLEVGEEMSVTHGRVLGSKARIFDANGRELAWGQLAVPRAARGEPSFMHEERLVFDDGTVRDLLGNATPLRDANGAIRGAVGAFVDITERKRALDALQEERRALAALHRMGTAMAAELDPERLAKLITKASVRAISARFGAFLHRVVDETGERMVLCALSGAARPDFEKFQVSRAADLFQAALKSNTIIRSDDILADPRFSATALQAGQGRPTVRSFLAVPVTTRAGNMIGTLVFGHAHPDRFVERHERLMAGVAVQAAISLDNAHLYRAAQLEIEQRKRAESHQRLLIAELNHRVKNTLAIVQGVAHQTFRESADMEEARRAFEGRLAALSSAHNVLTQRNWEHARFAEIVEGALAPFHPPGGGRAVVSGDDMQVEPKTAVSLAMAFHELATNAVKYGAWSNETGRVVVTWQVAQAEQGPRLQLLWQEEGGPPVAVPRRKGFGSRMVERALAGELDGTVRLVFDKAGLRCEIDAPLPSAKPAFGMAQNEGSA